MTPTVAHFSRLRASQSHHQPHRRKRERPNGFRSVVRKVRAGSTCSHTPIALLSQGCKWCLRKPLPGLRLVGFQSSSSIPFTFNLNAG